MLYGHNLYKITLTKFFFVTSRMPLIIKSRALFTDDERTYLNNVGVAPYYKPNLSTLWLTTPTLLSVSMDAI